MFINCKRIWHQTRKKHKSFCLNEVILIKLKRPNIVSNKQLTWIFILHSCRLLWNDNFIVHVNQSGTWYPVCTSFFFSHGKLRPPSIAKYHILPTFTTIQRSSEQWGKSLTLKYVIQKCFLACRVLILRFWQRKSLSSKKKIWFEFLALKDKS